MMQVVIYRVCYQNHNDTVLHCMRVTSIFLIIIILLASMSIKRMHTTRGRSFFQITHTTSQCDDPHPVHAPC